MIKFNPITGKFDLTANIKNGTAVGQMTFWDGTRWVHTETSEMFWDDTNKRLGVGTATPSTQFHTTGGVRLAGIAGNYSNRRMVVSDTSGNLSYRDLENPISLLDAPFGQYALYSPTTNNLLYSADKRFTVTQTGFSATNAATLFNSNYDENYNKIAASGTGVININLIDKGEYGADGLLYSYGWVYLHFYSIFVPASASVRLKTKNAGGTFEWRTPVNAVNIATASNYVVYKIPLYGNYYCSDIEITINSGAVETWLAEVEFILNRSVDSKVQPIVSKSLSNSLYDSMLWKDSSNVLKAGIYPSTGNGYFEGKVGIGTITPTAKLHLAGNTSDHFAQIDTGINLTYVVSPGATTAVVQNVPGNIDAGTHRYCISYFTPIGETDIHSVSPTYTFDAANGQAIVNLPISSDYRVTGRKIYRDTSGNYVFKLVATINDNTTTTYLDNISDANMTGLGSWYKENNTSGQIKFNGAKSLFVGIYNTTLGLSAGASLSVVGSSNTLIGASAGIRITDGQQNTCLGSSAGAYITTSGANTYVGSMAGYKSTGNGNSFLGNYAGGIGALTGGGNCLFGAQTGYNLGAGFNNSIFGYYAGHIGAGSSNMFFGWYAGRYETGSNKLIIDSLNRTDEAISRTSALIYGITSSVPANQILSLGGGGKVGIGTITPTAKLHLPAGTATANTAPLKFTAGVLNTTAEAGAVEFVDDGTNGHLYITLNIDGVLTRKEIAFV